MEKFGKEDLVLAALVIMVATAFSLVYASGTESGAYPVLLKAAGALKGEPASFFEKSLAGVHSVLAGQALSKEFFALEAAWLPVVFAVISCVSMFLAFRMFLARLPSVVGAFVFLFALLPGSGMLSGNLAPESAAMAALSIALLAFIASARLNAILGVVSGIFLAVAVLFSQQFIFAGMSFFLSAFLYSARLSLEKKAWQNPFYASLCALVPFAAVLAFFQALAIPGVSVVVRLEPSIMLLAGLAAFPFAFETLGKREVALEETFVVLFALFSFVSFFAFPALAPVGLGLAAGIGVKDVFAFERDRKASGLAFLLLCFFSFAAITADFVEVQRAVAISFGMTAIAGLVAWLYQERKELASAAFYSFAFTAFFILFLGLFSLQASRSPLSLEALNEISWAKGAPQNAMLASLEAPAALKFESGRSVFLDETVLARFLLSNASSRTLAQNGITHFLVDAKIFDELDRLRVLANESRSIADSFAFTGRYAAEDTGASYAEFVSPKGLFMYHPADQETGRLTDGNVIIQDIGSVSKAKLLYLKVANISGFSASDRYIYPRTGFNYNLFKLFFTDNFGQVQGVNKVFEKDGLLVFEVEN